MRAAREMTRILDNTLDRSNILHDTKVSLKIDNETILPTISTQIGHTTMTETKINYANMADTLVIRKYKFPIHLTLS